MPQIAVNSPGSRIPGPPWLTAKSCGRRSASSSVTHYVTPRGERCGRRKLEVASHNLDAGKLTADGAGQVIASLKEGLPI